MLRNYTVRPLSPNGMAILTEDIIVPASHALMAKEKARAIYEGAFAYQIVDVEITEWVGVIKHQRERDGFGM